MLREDIRIRDPFIYAEDNTYYLLGTTGNDCWSKGSNFTLYASEDLHTFRVVGTMVKEGVLDGYTQLWAPELHRYRDKYYLIVSLFCPEKRRGKEGGKGKTLRNAKNAAGRGRRGKKAGRKLWPLGENRRFPGKERCGKRGTKQRREGGGEGGKNGVNPAE